jgi:hypothetical protein
MVRGDMKVWLQASGWKFDSKGKRWLKGDLVLWVESSLIDSDRLTWLLTDGKVKLGSGSGVTETLQSFLQNV